MVPPGIVIAVVQLTPLLLTWTKNGSISWGIVSGLSYQRAIEMTASLPARSIGGEFRIVGPPSRSNEPGDGSDLPPRRALRMMV